MTYFKLSFLFSAAVATMLIACGSDDSGGDSGDDGENASNGANATNGSGGSGGTNAGTGDGGSSNGGTSNGGSSSGNTTNGNTTSGNTTTGGGGGNACNPDPSTGGTGGSEECAELGECVQRECSAEYKECMGPNFASGDFRGGVCEDYMECVNDCNSGDDCDLGCVLECLENVSTECQSCLTEAGECSAEACPDEYEACNGSEQPTGGTGSGGDGTCTDLEECCNSLEDDAQDACLATLEAVQQGGDQACAIMLASYQGAGAC